MPKIASSKSEAAAMPQLLRLTKTNYPQWSMMMECYLQAQGWCDAIEKDETPRKMDRQALTMIFNAVSEDFLAYLDAKKTAKQNWETLRVIHIGVNRVVEARVQGLRQDFELLSMGKEERVPDYAAKFTDVSFSRVVKSQRRWSNKIYKTELTKIRYKNQVLCKYRVDPQRAGLTLIAELTSSNLGL